MGDILLPDFSEIIQGCKEGNRKYYEMLYKSYYGYVISIALRYVINREIAEESTNDCFMKVFSNIHHYDEKKNFKTWLRRIAINTCIDCLRKEKRFLSSDNEKINETMIYHGYSWIDCIMPELDYEFLLTLLKKLPEIQRIVFNMYEIEGYSHYEISEKLAIRESSSRTYLMRAKKRLQREIMNY